MLSCLLGTPLKRRVRCWIVAAATHQACCRSFGLERRRPVVYLCGSSRRLVWSVYIHRLSMHHTSSIQSKATPNTTEGGRRAGTRDRTHRPSTPRQKRTADWPRALSIPSVSRLEGRLHIVRMPLGAMRAAIACMHRLRLRALGRSRSSVVGSSPPQASHTDPSSCLPSSLLCVPARALVVLRISATHSTQTHRSLSFLPRAVLHVAAGDRQQQQGARGGVEASGGGYLPSSGESKAKRLLRGFAG